MKVFKPGSDLIKNGEMKSGEPRDEFCHRHSGVWRDCRGKTDWPHRGESSVAN